MYVPSCPNRAAETAGDFVVAQINVRAARRADCGSGAATNLLFPFTFETLDNRAVLPFPKILNKSLNFAIVVEGEDGFGRNSGLAVVQAPRSLPPSYRRDADARYGNTRRRAARRCVP